MFSWIICTIFYFYQYILRILPNIFNENLTHYYSMNSEQFGYYSAFYYLGYAPMHLVIGYFLDHIDLKKMFTLGLIGTALSLGLTLVSDHYYIAYLQRFLLGSFSAFAVLCLFKTIRNHFQERFSFFLGLSVTIGLCAPIFIHPIFSSLYLIEDYLFQSRSWTFILKYLSLMGFLLGIFSFLLMKSQMPSKNEQSFFQELKSVLTNTRFLLVSLAGGFFIGPLEGFSDSWSIKLTQTLYSFLTHEESLKITSLLFLGMGLSSSPLGYYFDKTKKHFIGTFFLALIMFISFFLLLFPPVIYSSFLIYVLFFILGIGCSYQVPIVYESIKHLPDSLTGFASASCNMLIMLFGMFYHAIIGYFMDYYDFSLDPINTYQKTFSVIPLGIALGLSLLLLSRFKKN